MVPLQPFLSWLFSLLFLLPLIATSAQNCPATSCGNVNIKFPFQQVRNRFRGGVTSRCGYPGFGLRCNYQNQTILTIESRAYIVQDIDYDIQNILIKDPQNCLPKQYLNGISFFDSPFYPDSYSNFTFFNCSTKTTLATNRYRPISCLSDENNTVIALPSMFYDESRLPSSSCEETSTVSVPFWGFWSDLEDSLRLMWSSPYCELCEQRGEACGFKNDSGLEVECSHPSGSNGLSRGTKYGIVIGVGIPGALCIIGLGCILCRRARNYNSQRHLLNAELSNSIAQPQRAVILTGLDEPTIESYPKTLLGESGRLPKPNDNTCPICLSEYQPKESLRTIPECEHYFHADCIDEWLKMNATCPLCRNSPESSAKTPSSTLTSSHSPGTLSSTSASSHSSPGLSP
ncbi:hypothetical protein Patl1_17529 [Pistacia atlantica]|uniref:Uncharacterized protein n=1 Tax=Pistacia atlantica TaxID=434234 RepID=A0ACC1BXF5_9ROSI|nr:hypothetical protein Patl1_17529 [Pistacia atlantica]